MDSGRRNRLRAGVLGANDGIISTAGLVIGVAAANSSTTAIATAGIASLASGAVSMGLGEYVSVSTQRDSELSVIRSTRERLDADPAGERLRLTRELRSRGLNDELSAAVAEDLSKKDPVGAHLVLEAGIDERNLASPWAAARSSAFSFSLGALIPLAAILLPGRSVRVPVAGIAVIIALALTGWTSARLGESPVRPAVLRLVVGGAIGMAFAFVVGQLLNVSAL